MLVLLIQARSWLQLGARVPPQSPRSALGQPTVQRVTSPLSQYHAMSIFYCKLLKALRMCVTSRVSMVLRSGLFTSGRSSPNSEYSERIMFPRREYESESEPGPKRRAHRSRADHSDSEAEYKSRHFVTR